MQFLYLIIGVYLLGGFVYNLLYQATDKKTRQAYIAKYSKNGQAPGHYWMLANGQLFFGTVGMSIGYWIFNQPTPIIKYGGLIIFLISGFIAMKSMKMITFRIFNNEDDS